MYNLKKYRLAARLTQNQVAQATNISQAYYCALEKGARGKTLPLRTAARLAEALGCAVDDLLKDEPQDA